MGEVWLAEDTTLKRKVAIKVLPAGVATDPDRLARFQREAEAVAALSHPNIVTIHSIEMDGGAPRRLSSFADQLIFRFAWSRDGRTSAVSRGDLTTDVVMITSDTKKQVAGDAHEPTASPGFVFGPAPDSVVGHGMCLVGPASAYCRPPGVRPSDPAG